MLSFGYGSLSFPDNEFKTKIITRVFHLRPFPSTCQHIVRLEFSAYFSLPLLRLVLHPFHPLRIHMYYSSLIYKIVESIVNPTFVLITATNEMINPSSSFKRNISKLPFYSLISFTPGIHVIMVNIKTISSYHTMLFRMSLDKEN